MKKSNLKKMVLLGLAGGLVLSSQSVYAQSEQFMEEKVMWEVAQKKDSKMKKQKGITEKDLLAKLDKKGKAQYAKLDAQGKKTALKFANQKCAGMNGCKGLNACKSANNACSGQGNCKGQSKLTFDAKTAVRVAAMRMADRRAKMMRGK